MVSQRSFYGFSSTSREVLEPLLIMEQRLVVFYVVTVTTHPHLSPKLKEEYSYTSTPPLGLRGLF